MRNTSIGAMVIVAFLALATAPLAAHAEEVTLIDVYFLIEDAQTLDPLGGARVDYKLPGMASFRRFDGVSQSSTDPINDVRPPLTVNFFNLEPGSFFESIEFRQMGTDSSPLQQAATDFWNSPHDLQPGDSYTVQFRVSHPDYEPKMLSLTVSKSATENAFSIEGNYQLGGMSSYSMAIAYYNIQLKPMPARASETPALPEPDAARTPEPLQESGQKPVNATMLVTAEEPYESDLRLYINGERSVILDTQTVDVESFRLDGPQTVSVGYGDLERTFQILPGYEYRVRIEHPLYPQPLPTRVEDAPGYEVPPRRPSLLPEFEYVDGEATGDYVLPDDHRQAELAFAGMGALLGFAAVGTPVFGIDSGSVGGGAVLLATAGGAAGGWLIGRVFNNGRREPEYERIRRSLPDNIEKNRETVAEWERDVDAAKLRNQDRLRQAQLEAAARNQEIERLNRTASGITVEASPLE